MGFFVATEGQLSLKERVSKEREMRHAIMQKAELDRLHVQIQLAKDALDQKQAYARNVRAHEDKFAAALIGAGHKAREAVETRKQEKEESIVRDRQQAVDRYQAMILEWKEDAVTQQEQRTRMQTFLAEEQEFGASVQMM